MGVRKNDSGPAGPTGPDYETRRADHRSREERVGGAYFTIRSLLLGAWMIMPKAPKAGQSAKTLRQRFGPGFTVGGYCFLIGRTRPSSRGSPPISTGTLGRQGYCSSCDSPTGSDHLCLAGCLDSVRWSVSRARVYVCARTRGDDD